MWYVQPAKVQTSLCIRLSLEDSKTGGTSRLKRRLHRLLSVYTCQNATLLEIFWNNNEYAVELLLYTEPIKKHSTKFEIELLNKFIGITFMKIKLR